MKKETKKGNGIGRPKNYTKKEVEAAYASGLRVGAQRAYEIVKEAQTLGLPL